MAVGEHKGSDEEDRLPRPTEQGKPEAHEVYVKSQVITRQTCKCCGAESANRCMS